MELDPEQMRTLFPLDKLGRRSLTHIVEHTRILELGRGDTLFRIGDTTPLTFYALKGKIVLRNAKGEKMVVDGNTDQTRYAIGNLLPRRVKAVAASRQTLVACIDRDLLDKELTWGQLSGDDANGKADSKGKKPPVSPEEENEEREWKLSLLRTPVFKRLPMASVQALFGKLEEIRVKTGQMIIREGDPGDYFYIIRKGRCKVVRMAGDREILLNTLADWDSFGDEALVSDQPRRASVIMEGDGVLRRLTKADFQQLMHAPLLKHVTLRDAYRMMSGDQAVLIDVRMEDEFAQNRLRDSINIPLYMLYLKYQELSKGIRYILYCDTGSRSEAAAFILAQKGLKAYVLDNAADALAMTAC